MLALVPGCRPGQSFTGLTCSLIIPPGLLRQQVWCHWVPRVAEPWAEGLGEGRHQDDAGVPLPGRHGNVQRLQDKVGANPFKGFVAPGLTLLSLIFTLLNCPTNNHLNFKGAADDLCVCVRVCSTDIIKPLCAHWSVFRLNKAGDFPRGKPQTGAPGQPPPHLPNWPPCATVIVLTLFDGYSLQVACVLWALWSNLTTHRNWRRLSTFNASINVFLHLTITFTCAENHLFFLPFKEEKKLR